MDISGTRDMDNSRCSCMSSMKHTSIIGTCSAVFLNLVGWIYGTLADDQFGHFLSSCASLASISVAVITISVVIYKWRTKKL